MSPAAPTPAVRRLLELHLDSFEKLEITLALARANADGLALSELRAAAAVDHDTVLEAVRELEASGLIEHSAPDRVRLSPVADPVTVAALAELYDEDRALVATLLAQRAMGRIRGMAARAFTLRKSDPESD